MQHEPRHPALGQYLRNRRRELGLTTLEVATRSGINRAQVVRIENGTSASPNADSLKGLARALDLDLADVWAAAGYQEASQLPAPMLYLRAKYRDLPESALQTLSKEVARVLREHGLESTTRPAPGEDETDDETLTSPH